MKKVAFILALMTVTTSAFAISDASLVSKCTGKAYEKLTEAAQVQGCNMDSVEVTFSSLSNGKFNPSKYVWYEAEANCGEDTMAVSALVQYDSMSGKCF